MKRMDDAQEQVFGRADHRDAGGARGGVATGDLCPKYGLSSATFYEYKAKLEDKPRVLQNVFRADGPSRMEIQSSPIEADRPVSLGGC